MADKQRALPSWMIKRKEEVKEPLKSRRKHKTARVAFYCMNEKELVEAAMSCLVDDDRQEALLQTHQQVEEKTKDEPITLKRTSKPMDKTSDETTDCSDDQDATYVSETDLDITELETVPYTETPQHAGTEGQRSEPDQDRGRPTNPDVQRPAAAAEDDDAFRLVREIFFT